MKYFVCLIVFVTFVEFSLCQRGSYSGLGTTSANQATKVQPAQVQPMQRNRVDSHNEVDSNDFNNQKQFGNNLYPNINSNNWFGNVETEHEGNRQWRTIN